MGSSVTRHQRGCWLSGLRLRCGCWTVRVVGHVLLDELRLGFRWAENEVQQINNLSEVRPGRGTARVGWAGPALGRRG